ncbi:MAG: shikimate kinase [Rhizobacter sp.]|nr:shikimate kinase [Chlorobiales bacterium]
MQATKKANLIFLTGFSTAGKSTIGPILANALGFEFLDVDKEVIDIEKKSVNDIFAEKGEAYFRTIEHEVIRKASERENVIVALGGGSLEHDQSFEVIKQTGTLIYLKSELETLTRRLSAKDDRPMLKNESGEKISAEEVALRVGQLMATREARYLSHALISVYTDKTPIGKTVESLVRQIEKHLKDLSTSSTASPAAGDSEPASSTPSTGAAAPAQAS